MYDTQPCSEVHVEADEMFSVLPEYAPNGDIDVEAQTHEQSELNTSSEIPRNFASESMLAYGLNTDSPQVPPPSYTPNRRPSMQTQLTSYSLVAHKTSGASGRD